MKIFAFAMMALLFFSCSTEKNREEVLRELAQKDAIEKLDLPEGTKFSNEDLEITETQTGEASMGISYLVKITVKSQDREGNIVTKTHTLTYNLSDGGGLAPEDYELVSFD